MSGSRVAARWSSAVGVVGALLLALGLVGVLAAQLFGPGDRGPDRAPRSDALVPADVDRDTPVPETPVVGTATALLPWADTVAARTGVPARALQAYGLAELGQRQSTPECRLSWTLLAGIGRVESDHGRLGRAELGTDGVPRPLIVGIPLDGTRDTREILDTDGGALDADVTYDRAVGPMQFLPATWARFGADGNGDGIRDPHQLDDAARAAAAYLCADGRDTASGAGWWAGVLTYNRSEEYARLVWAAANRYATASTS